MIKKNNTSEGKDDERKTFKMHPMRWINDPAMFI